MQDSERAQEAKCGLCGEPMPEGEEMFKFHGYSGGCPKPPLAEVAKYLGSMLAVDPPPSGASPQAETSEQDVPVLRITVTRDVATEYYAAEFRSADDKVGGMGDYSATPVGALANLCATLIQIDEDNSVERRQPTPVSPVEPESSSFEANTASNLLQKVELSTLDRYRNTNQMDVDTWMVRAVASSEPRSEDDLVLLDHVIALLKPTVEPEPPKWRYVGDGVFTAAKVEPEPCVWRITSGPLGTWVNPTCVEGAIPAPWGTERAKACHLCGAPLKVEREP